MDPNLLYHEATLRAAFNRSIAPDLRKRAYLSTAARSFLIAQHERNKQLITEIEVMIRGYGPALHDPATYEGQSLV